MGLSWDEAQDTLGIKMVLHTTLLALDPDLDKDQTWKDFLASPEDMQFERVEIGSEYGYLLVHESLLD